MFADDVDSAWRARYEVWSAAIIALELLEEFLPSGCLCREGVFCVDVLQGLCDWDRSCHGGGLVLAG